MKPTAILVLVQDLAEAIALMDAEATFTTCEALAARIGRPAAVAIAEALYNDVTRVLGVRPTSAPAELASCA